MTRRAGLPFRLVGALLLAVPLLPFTPLVEREPGGVWLEDPARAALHLAVLLVAAWGAALALRRSGLGTSGRPDLLRGWRPEVALAALLAGVLGLVSWRVFGGSPATTDSVAQLFQAKIFAGGSLTAPAPPEPGFFATLNTLVHEGRWMSQYPPGHPAALAAGVLAGASWLVPLALTLGSAGFLYGFCREAYDRATARVALALFALAPFVWLMGASHMSHVTLLFCATGALYGVALATGPGGSSASGRRARTTDPGGGAAAAAPGGEGRSAVNWLARGGPGPAWLAGGLLGLGFLARPLDAVAVAVPLAAALFLLGGRRGAPDPAGVRRGGPEGEQGPLSALGGPGGTVLGGPGAGRALRFLAALVAVGALYLAYNAATTGGPLRTGYELLWGGLHGPGFHATPWGGAHTPLAGLRNEVKDLALLNARLFLWPVPGLWPVAVALAAGGLRRRWDRILVAGLLAVPAAYFFYWHRDTVLGPRYLYATPAFVVPLTARAVVGACRRWEGADVRLAGAPLHLSAGAAVALFVAYAAVVPAPRWLGSVAGRSEAMQVDLVERARRAGLEEGVLFVPVSWGNRLLTRMRGLGVPAGRVTRAYRGLDHCRLHALTERALEEGWSGPRVGRELRRLLSEPARGELVRRPDLNGDATLRLRRGRALTPDCAREIAYDRRGYTAYTPHLAANDPWLRSDFVVARDQRCLNRRLTGRFPGRPAFLHRKGRFVPLEESGYCGDDDPGREAPRRGASGRRRPVGPDEGADRSGRPGEEGGSPPPPVLQHEEQR